MRTSQQNAENLIYELVADGFDISLKEGSFKFMTEPSKTISTILDAIARIEDEQTEKINRRWKNKLEGIGGILTKLKGDTLLFKEISINDLEKLDEEAEIYAIVLKNFEDLNESLREKAKRLERRAKNRLHRIENKMNDI